jgi:hypothetical protein
LRGLQRRAAKKDKPKILVGHVSGDPAELPENIVYAPMCEDSFTASWRTTAVEKHEP